MNKRFELEQQILDCWHVTSDLDILLENIIENDSFTRDDISNVVLGLSTLYNLKFDRVFRTFESIIDEERTGEAQKLLDALTKAYDAQLPDPGSAYIEPLNPRVVSDEEFDKQARPQPKRKKKVKK